MTKHNGINATRDVLRLELARAATAQINERMWHQAAIGMLRLPKPSPWPVRVKVLAGFALGVVTAVVL